MSYNQKDEDIEIGLLMSEVLETRDVEGAKRIARYLIEKNDEEGANNFLQMANKWEREDNYHDELNDN